MPPGTRGRRCRTSRGTQPPRSSSTWPGATSAASSTRARDGPSKQEEDDMETANRQLSRRELLRLAGGATAAAGLAPYVRTGAAFGRPSSTTIKMWWWGQQEAVGIQKWMNDTIAKFKAQQGI